MRIALVVFLTIAGCTFLMGGCSYELYELHRDLAAVQTRAQVAADRDDMIKYTRELRDNLEEHDATTGHAALIFKYPSNDLALQYESVNRIIQRLESLEGVERNTTTYQVALDDIRGTLRELPELSSNLMWARRGWWSFLCIIGLSFLGFAVGTLAYEHGKRR